MNAMIQRLWALVRLRCPKCYQEKMFTYNNMYSWRKSDVMPVTCKCCGQPFTPEPGFYYGAMYMSYALYAALFIPAFIATILMDLSYEVFYISFVCIALLVSPYIFRLSRAVYLYFFVDHEEIHTKIVLTKQPFAGQK
ncbi:hypothetical protein CHU_1011 [Cytophaga hutchinsonii ATCC 33406]|uniref:DUF983 domain-containing protein n=2 Tax=Cytophaga hutchinsonii TaxID=985 RepID=A0A6N4SPS0_CYTH3|nr:hypothetical protein CHU_1011 [Cytophaga hutchinsonii ATCC 33406]SFX53299.1 Protein of unknown function [Cytophaga hutchinsonii ATCC 33406]